MIDWLIMKIAQVVGKFTVGPSCQHEWGMWAPDRIQWDQYRTCNKCGLTQKKRI